MSSSHMIVVTTVITMNLLYQDGANTTITVLRVPAGVSEYGWMLEKSHFVYMWTRESPEKAIFKLVSDQSDFLTV